MVNGLEITDAAGRKHWKEIRAYKAQCPMKHAAFLIKSAQREDEMVVHCHHCGSPCNITSYGTTNV